MSVPYAQDRMPDREQGIPINESLSERKTPQSPRFARTGLRQGHSQECTKHVDEIADGAERPEDWCFGMCCPRSVLVEDIFVLC